MAETAAHTLIGLFCLFLLCLGVVDLLLFVAITILIYAILRKCEGSGFQTPAEQSRRAISLVVLFACYFAALVTGSFIIYLTLLFGWAPLLARTIPKAQLDWPAIGVAIGALIAFLGGSHWFATALYNRPAVDDRPARVWRPRWSACIVLGIFLTFASGLAAYGLVQSGIEVWKLRENR